MALNVFPVNTRQVNDVGLVTYGTFSGNLVTFDQTVVSLTLDSFSPNLVTFRQQVQYRYAVDLIELVTFRQQVICTVPSFNLVKFRQRVYD